MLGVVHFQTKLQTPICVNRRLKNTTFDRSKVTCGNCIQRLKYQSLGFIDWDGIYKSVKEKEPVVQLKLKEFGLAHPQVKSRAVLENRPPQIALEFWFPAPKKTRRKTVGYNLGRGLESNIIPVLIPTDDEANEVATFVGQLGGEVGLTPRRHPERRDSVALVYQLRPQYRKN